MKTLLMLFGWFVVFPLTYRFFIQWGRKKEWHVIVQWGGGFIFSLFIMGLYLGITSIPETRKEQAKQKVLQVQAEAQAKQRNIEQARIKAQEKEVTKKKEEDACKQSIQCWGDKHLLAATISCQPWVEKLAKYDHQWIDGWTETKFSRFRWQNSIAKSVTYIGDKIKYQNGFGAWQHMIYECDYDVLGKKVIDVRATPGHL